MKNLLIALTVAASVITPSAVEAGCCNSGSGSYRLPGYSSSPSSRYETYVVDVTNETKDTLWIIDKYDQTKIKPGKTRTVLVNVNRNGDVQRLRYVLWDYTGNNEVPINYMPSPSQNKQLVFRVRGSKLRYYWVNNLGR